MHKNIKLKLIVRFPQCHFGTWWCSAIPKKILTMAAEMLQKYSFIFNTFKKKTIYSYIQSKNCFSFVRILSSKKYIYIQSKYTCVKKYSIKKNVFNEHFLFNDFRQSNLVFHLPFVSEIA